MSKFTEYINLAIKGLPHSPEILQGIVTNIQLKHNTLSEDKKAEIVRRRIICSVCPFMSTNVSNSKEYENLTGKSYISTRNTPHCCMCGCPLESKTASFGSNCGIETWNSENPDKMLDLKWIKYEQDKENSTEVSH
jgi:hypothetical protein